jgi:hypothetical protein
MVTSYTCEVSSPAVDAPLSSRQTGRKLRGEFDVRPAVGRRGRFGTSARRRFSPTVKFSASFHQDLFAVAGFVASPDSPLPTTYTASAAGEFSWKVSAATPGPPWPGIIRLPFSGGANNIEGSAYATAYVGVRQAALGPFGCGGAASVITRSIRAPRSRSGSPAADAPTPIRFLSARRVRASWAGCRSRCWRPMG